MALMKEALVLQSHKSGFLKCTQAGGRGRFVAAIHAEREIIILNCIELNNSELLELLAHFSNKKRTTQVRVMVLKFFPDNVLLLIAHALVI